MNSLDKSQISSWKRQKGGYHDSYFPGAINSHCPHCHSLVSFSFTHWHKALHGLAIGKTLCPSCEETTRFMLMDYDPSSQAFDDDTSLWIYPPLKVQEVLKGVSETEELNDQLSKAYKSTISVFNTGEWNATAILIRRFLDGLIENGVGRQDSHRSLGEQLESLLESRDLEKPVKEITEAMSDPMMENVFTLEQEPTKPSAELMVEFTNLLVEYLYIIPMRARKLHEQALKLQNSNVSPLKPIEKPIEETAVSTRETTQNIAH